MAEAVRRYLTDPEVGEASKDLWSADAQLMGARQGRRGNPRSAAGKACKARRPESTRGRVGS